MGSKRFGSKRTRHGRDPGKQHPNKLCRACEWRKRNGVTVVQCAMCGEKFSDEPAKPRRVT